MNKALKTTEGSETIFQAAMNKALAKKKPTPQTEALKNAVVRAGTLPELIQRPPTNARRSINRRRVEKRVIWKRHEFGSIMIGMEQFRIGHEADQGPYVWTQIRRADHTPPQMHITFVGELAPDTVLLHAQGGVVTDVTHTAIPNLPVVINWNEEGVPHTRRKNQDNVDFVFMRRRDGKFIQVQVSLVTRRGRFYIAIQEIWAGQVVRTTLVNAKEIGLNYHSVIGADGREYAAIVAPLFDDNAYPGADYLKTFSGMGPKVIEYANLNGMTAPLSSAVVAEWTPMEVNELPVEMVADGFMTGVVTFFNLVVNYGFIQGSDGKSYFVYGDNVVLPDLKTPLVRDGFPVLEPMKGVVFKVGQGKDGKPQAVNVYQPTKEE